MISREHSICSGNVRPEAQGGTHRVIIASGAFAFRAKERRSEKGMVAT